MSNTVANRWSWFAVWHWPRWAWAVIVALMLGGYVLSPPVTVQLMMRDIVSVNVGKSAEFIQSPLLFAADHFHALSDLYQVESDLIDKALGRRRSQLVWIGGRYVIVF